MIKGKEVVERSKKVAFVAGCMLCQAIRAQGVSIKFPAAVTPIIEFLMKNKVNIIQMPCPEIKYGNVIRKAARKEDYDNPEFRKICGEYAKQVVDIIKKLRKANFEIIAILGIENSPACGVTLVFRKGRGRVHEAGVFIEELRKLLSSENLQDIPILGIETFNVKKSLSKLESFFKQKELTEFK